MLRALSANARAEHLGGCEFSLGEVIEDRCAQVRDSGMCADLTDCETVIIPDDGCCPVCGELLCHNCSSSDCTIFIIQHCVGAGNN